MQNILKFSLFLTICLGTVVSFDGNDIAAFNEASEEMGCKNAQEPDTSGFAKSCREFCNNNYEGSKDYEEKFFRCTFCDYYERFQKVCKGEKSCKF